MRRHDVPKWAPAEAKWVCATDDASDGGETARHVNVQASCPAGYTVTGGGFSASSDVEVTASHALGNGWRVLADGPAFSLISRFATAYATCARI